MTPVGRVSLVGAGPGAADLLTLRAVRALESADLVLYDALVDPSVLDFASRAHRFFVGKRAGRPSIAQSTIHALMIRAAKRGQNVVRLKCGDPFVLGRGGEEVLALGEAGIEADVIPGLSSAVAAPAALGIPVTHRGLAPGFLVLSAVPSLHYRRVLGGLTPASVTVVMMMALGARAEIASFLLERGWARDVPVAIVIDATLPTQRSWLGTLAKLGGVTLESANGAGLIVIGPVVSLAKVVEQPEVSSWVMDHR
jgi:uroporphyrin-III C-methyltransferase